MSPVTAYLLYAVCAIGGVSLYLMLPRGRASGSLAGGVLGLAALAMLIALLVTRLGGASAASGGGVSGPSASGTGGLLFSIIAIASASRVITHRKPVFSALYFVLTVVAVAALLVLQQAEFLAIALVIIYAGAILVTYLFVMMLAHTPGSPVYDHQAREPLAAVFVCLVLMATIMTRVGTSSGDDHGWPADRSAMTTARLVGQGVSLEAGSEELPPSGNTLAIGWLVMTRYVVVLELAGVLLLVSMVGAIAMSRRRVEPEVPQWPDRPLGQIGKEVPPF